MRAPVLRRIMGMLLAVVGGGHQIRPRVVAILVAGILGGGATAPGAESRPGLDAALRRVLTAHGFTGQIEARFRHTLGRPIERPRANLGRLLWFDLIGGLNDDNTCGGCHSPTHGFGDTQPMAIGIDNNLRVGLQRTGPRNQRRTPLAANTALYPTLMWNSRFAARSGDPFDNRAGFAFPLPAYSTDACHPVHGKAATHSIGCLPPSPREACHVDHGKVATHSRRSLPPSERSDAGHLLLV